MEARRDTVERARELRSHTSLPEGLLWRQLRERQLAGLKFRRQHPMGPYVLDFFCSALGLVVEVDGQHHNDAEQRRRDTIRDRWLEQHGMTVLRVPAQAVLADIDSVIAMIRDFVGARPR